MATKSKVMTQIQPKYLVQPLQMIVQQPLGKLDLNIVADTGRTVILMATWRRRALTYLLSQ